MKLLPSRLKAFSLVEVTLALGIASFTLLAVFGLMPIGMNATRASTEQTLAADIATVIAADIYQLGDGVGNQASGGEEGEGGSGDDVVSSKRFGIKLPGATGSHGESLNPVFYLDDSLNRSSVAQGARYRVLVDLYNYNGFGAVGNITITWPAAANPPNVMGTFKVPVAVSPSIQ